MPLNGKTALITGATSGFGEATARALAGQGARVILTGRRKDRLEALTNELAHALPLHLDIRDNAAIKAAIANLPADWAAIDLLVNNAGLALNTASFENQPLEDLDQMMQTNNAGLVYITHAVLPGMIARGSGQIINISSVAGSYPYPGGNVYGATKAFVTQFSLNLRADLVAKNIRVTSIEPGLAETEFSLVRFHGDAEKAKAVYTGTEPLIAKDIADAVLYCVTAPAHVNINRLEIMPTCQAFGSFAIHRHPS